MSELALWLDNQRWWHRLRRHEVDRTEWVAPRGPAAFDHWRGWQCSNCGRDWLTE